MENRETFAYERWFYCGILLEIRKEPTISDKMNNDIFCDCFKAGRLYEKVERIEEKLDCLTHQIGEAMSKISDYAVEQKSFNARLETAVRGLGDDIKSLNDMIGQVVDSPEDTALLAELRTQGNDIATRFEALDSLTPPVIPPVV